MGFSTNACFPAFAAAMASSACVLVVVAITTASMSERDKTSSQLLLVSLTAIDVATVAARSLSMSQQRTSWTCSEPVAARA